ncbi:MAG TPA: RHS repeat-associated core domain-containing protein [Tepidisphaeraceae bacterium]|nr:RHS repeat-associated core domain-containing protein [Tepidisphaeraceae bacterium]
MKADLSGQVVAVAVDASGNILVAQTNADDDAVTVVRFTSSGAVDTSFGTDGVATFALPNGGDPSSMFLQSDGKIVIGGWTVDKTTGNNDFIAVRFNAAGSVDADFGTDGIATASFGDLSINSIAMALSPDGKIIMGGYTNGDGVNYALVRFDADGTLDSGFGTGGEVVSTFGDLESADISVTVQSAGKVIAAGYVQDETTGLTSVAVARYNADGTPDDTFGTDGQVITAIGDSSGAIAVAVQSDGKIIVGANGGAPTNPSAVEMAILRYNPDGTLDRSFGAGGIVTTDTSAEPSAQAMAIASNGEILLAGSATGGSHSEFAVARYEMPTAAGGLTQRLYAQHDANFNITAYADNSGNVVERFVYSPYGVQTVLTADWIPTIDSLGVVYGFQGGRMDAATGLIRFGLRDLNPVAQTWNEQDPAGYIDGPDRYQLETGSPTALLDPTGLCGEDPAQGADGAKGAHGTGGPHGFAGCAGEEDADLRDEDIKMSKMLRKSLSGSRNFTG